MILYENTTAKVRSPDGDTEFFKVLAGVLQGDTIAPYLFIICLDYILRTSIDRQNNQGFLLKRRYSKRHPVTYITDADYADDIALISSTIEGATNLLMVLEHAAAKIGLKINTKKTEYIPINCQGTIQSLSGQNLKSVDNYAYLGSDIPSSAHDIKIRIGKAWSALKGLTVVWKSNLKEDIKKSFFRSTVESVLLYGSSTWTLTKNLENTLNGAYTKMLRAVLNVSWKDHVTNKELYGKLLPITDVIRERRLRFAGHCFRNKNELASSLLLWTPTHGSRKSGRPCKTYIDQLTTDTGLTITELPQAMNDRKEWKRIVKQIRTSSTQEVVSSNTTYFILLFKIYQSIQFT